MTEKEMITIINDMRALQRQSEKHWKSQFWQLQLIATSAFIGVGWMIIMKYIIEA